MDTHPQPDTSRSPEKPSLHTVTHMPRLMVSTHLHQPRLGAANTPLHPPLVHAHLACFLHFQDSSLPASFPQTGTPTSPAHRHCPDGQQGWKNIQQVSQDSASEKVGLETRPLHQNPLTNTTMSCSLYSGSSLESPGEV